MTDTIDTTDTISNTDEIRNEVVITTNGRDIRIPMDTLGVTIDSSDRDVLNVVRPVIQGREGLDIQDDTGIYSYTVRKALNSNSIYVYPKPVAGRDADSNEPRLSSLQKVYHEKDILNIISSFIIKNKDVCSRRLRRLKLQSGSGRSYRYETPFIKMNKEKRAKMVKNVLQSIS